MPSLALSLTSRSLLPLLLTSCALALTATSGCGSSEGTVVDSAGGTGNATDSTSASGGTSGQDTSDAVLQPPVVTGVAEADASETLANLCEFFQPCDCPQHSYITVSACEDAFQQTTDSAVEEGASDLTYDGACVGEVAAGFEALGCMTTSEALQSLKSVRAIGQAVGCKMYYGDGAKGDACSRLTNSNGDSCQQGLACEDGMCVGLPQSTPAGGACSDTPECEAGLVCLPLDGGKYCSAAPEVGDDCLYGLLCDIDAECVDGSCAPLPGEGEPCTTATLATGARCTPGFTCASEVCVSLPQAGEPCTKSGTFGRPDCALGSACVDGTCEEEEPAICKGGTFPLFP